MKIHFQEEAFHAMDSLEQYLKTISLPRKTVELIKVRCSQLNECDYCINLHRKEALAVGESEQRLHELSDWKNSLLYTPVEKVALSIAEEVTLIPVEDDPSSAIQGSLNAMNQKQISEIIMTAVVINAWNRIMKSLNHGRVTRKKS